MNDVGFVKRKKLCDWLKQFGVIGEALSFVFKPNPQKFDSPESFKPNTKRGSAKINWSLYDVKGNVAQASKRSHWVNFMLKYKLLVPFTLITKRLVGKKLTKTIPRDPPNGLLNAYSDGVEDAIKLWTTDYLTQSEEKVLTGFSQELLRFEKDIEMTVAMNDNVYREFFNLKALFIAKRVLESNMGRSMFKHLFMPSHAEVQAEFVLDFYRMYPAVLNMEGDLKEEGFFVRKVGSGFDRVDIPLKKVVKE